MDCGRPYGALLLMIVCLGLAAYGVYSVVKGRYRTVPASTGTCAGPRAIHVAADGEPIEVVSEEVTEKALSHEALLHIEKKIDVALAAITELQRQIESRDAILARFICR